jgi:hypothetical protein
VSRPADGLDPPIVAAKAEQVERTRRKTRSRARSEVFVPYRLRADKCEALQVVPESCEARKVLALDRSQSDTLALEHLVTALGRVELRSDGLERQVKGERLGPWRR